jgi:hypothetical protein
VYLDDPIFEVYELLPKLFASKRPLALISKDCFLAMFMGFFKVLNSCKCFFWATIIPQFEITFYGFNLNKS